MMSREVVTKGLIVWTCALLDTIQDKTDKCYKRGEQRQL